MITFIKKHPSSKRYISILVIIGILIPVIFLTIYSGAFGWYTGMCFYAFITFWGTYEVANNLKISKFTSIYIGLLTLVTFIFPFDLITPSQINGNLGSNISQLVHNYFGWKSILILFLGSLITFIDKGMRESIAKSQIKIWIIIVTIFSVSLFAKFVWILNVFHPLMLLFYLPIAIVVDTFAYIGGKYFSKYIFKGAKMAPNISPKKTWGGSIIGYIVGALYIGIVGYYCHAFKSLENETIAIIIFALVLPMISIMGDLIFSGIKRYLMIKDFSNLIPGHGGIMDRLDAMSIVMLTIIITFLIW